MIANWKKKKVSGDFFRRVKRERDLALKTAREYDENMKRKKMEATSRNALKPIAMILNYVAPTAQSIGGIPAFQSIESVQSDFITPEKDGVMGSNDSDIDDLWENNDEDEKRYIFRTELRKWVVDNLITQSALKKLMKLLNAAFGENFPDDPRTFLETPLEVETIKMKDGSEYWHNGFERTIRSLFRNTTESRSISLNINMDGLPIFNSSKVEFWPILYNIAEMPKLQPIPIGIYCGTKKCDVIQFLTPFVNEIKEVIKNGIIINGHKITVQIRCIICDSPARSYVKGKNDRKSKKLY